MKPLVDLMGERFGRLLVVARAKNTKDGGAQWVCRCDCGTEKVNTRKNLIKGRVQSCGCLRRETSRVVGLQSATHGQSRSSEYRTWRGAIDRCHNSRSVNWKNYGARGIAVCQRWRDGFENFWADMGPKHSPRHSLDRIDVNGNYEPSNCRWADWDTQGNNRRTNHVVTIDGVQMTLAEAIRVKGQKSSRVRQRLAMGWDVERALNEASRPHSRRARG